MPPPIHPGPSRIQDPNRIYSELNSLTGVLAPNYALVDEHKRIVEAYKKRVKWYDSKKEAYKGKKINYLTE